VFRPDKSATSRAVAAVTGRCGDESQPGAKRQRKIPAIAIVAAQGSARGRTGSASAISAGSTAAKAAYALVYLSTRSTRLIGASLLEAVAVSLGVNRTRGGLHIAA
jgi:hypothetical protein